jgi:hypothetical protein
MYCETHFKWRLIYSTSVGIRCVGFMALPGLNQIPEPANRFDGEEI